MVKRKDFKRDFKTVRPLPDGLERSGSRFRLDGAATANERAPNFVAVLASTEDTAAGTCQRGSVELGRAQLYKPVDTA